MLDLTKITLYIISINFLYIDIWILRKLTNVIYLLKIKPVALIYDNRKHYAMNKAKNDWTTYRQTYI